VVAAASDRFGLLADLGVTVDASAFYPSIEDAYGQGDLPFLRVGDVNGFVDLENCEVIPAELCDQYPTLARVSPPGP
jgi:type I restriction enzyme, S subunit